MSRPAHPASRLGPRIAVVVVVEKSDESGHRFGTKRENGVAYFGREVLVRGEKLVDVNPTGVGVVVGKLEFVLFAGHRQAFDQSQPAIDAGEAAAAILEPAGDDFKGEPGPAGDVLA